MKNKRFLILIALVLVLTYIIKSDTLIIEEKIYDNNILKIGINSTSNGQFHPIFQEDSCDKAIVDIIYETLFDIDNEGNYKPTLAEKYDISDNKKSITFYLRKGVKWHSGNEFTAYDVKFTLEYIALMDRGRLFSNISCIKGIDEFLNGLSDTIQGITIINDYTIKITAEDEYAHLFEKLGTQIPIFSKYDKIDINSNGEKNEAVFKYPIGTGKYVFEKYVEGQYVLLKKNMEYWCKNSDIDNIMFKAIGVSSSYDLSNEEDIDIFYETALTVNEINEYKRTNKKVCKLPVEEYACVLLNNENKYLKNPNFRKGLMYSINREEIKNSISNQNTNIVNTACLSDQMIYSKLNLNSYNYNVDIGKLHFKKCPNLNYNKEFLVDENNDKIEFVLLYNRNDKIKRVLPSLLKENLSKVGIELITECVTEAEMLRRVKIGDYDMAITYLDSNIFNLVQYFHSNSIEKGENFSKFSNDKINMLLSNMEKYSNPGYNEKIYLDTLNILNYELPVLFLFEVNKYCIISSEVEGYFSELKFTR